MPEILCFAQWKWLEKIFPRNGKSALFYYQLLEIIAHCPKVLPIFSLLLWILTIVIHLKPAIIDNVRRGKPRMTPAQFNEGVPPQRQMFFKKVLKKAWQAQRNVLQWIRSQERWETGRPSNQKGPLRQRNEPRLRNAFKSILWGVYYEQQDD